MLKFGFITELNVKEGTVRVHFTDDGIVSNPLPVSVPATKDDKYHFPFSINENVWCIMDPNGEFGVVGGSVYSKKNSPPATFSEHKIDILIGGSKLKISMDKKTGKLSVKSDDEINIEAQTVNIQAATAVNLISPVEVKIQAPLISAMGNLAVSGSLTASGFTGTDGGPMVVNSNIESSHDVILSGLSVKSHKHISSSAGSPTGTPIP